jgi:histone H3/H4
MKRVAELSSTNALARGSKTVKDDDIEKALKTVLKETKE